MVVGVSEEPVHVPGSLRAQIAMGNSWGHLTHTPSDFGCNVLETTSSQPSTIWVASVSLARFPANPSATR